MNLTYEKCTIADLGVLVNISRDTFVTAFEKDNNPEDFWNYINQAFNENAMVEQLLNVNSTFYFVYLKNVLVGYLKLNKNEAQTEQFAKRSMELERIYVLKDFQSQGIGKQMLLKAIDMQNNLKPLLFGWVFGRKIKMLFVFTNHRALKYLVHILITLVTINKLIG